MKIMIMVLSGAYNLGDEKILQSEIIFFKSIFPNAQFFVATYDEKSFIGSKKNIEFFSFFPNNLKKNFFKNIAYFLKNVYYTAKSDIVVIGGGGIFFDNEKGISFSKNILEWRIRIFLARIFLKKIIFFWISLEIKNPDNYKKLAKIFKKSDTILTRDARSSEILKSIGISSQALYDSVFLNPGIKNSPKKEMKTIGIALRWGFWNENSLWEFKKFLQFLQEKNLEIIFLSHAFSWWESHNDVIFAEKNFGNYYTITKNMEETEMAYKNIDMMIGMRFHSIVLSAQNGIPSMIIPYWPKVFSLASILESEHLVLNTKNIKFSDYKEKFEFLYNNYEKEQDKISAVYTKIHTNFLQKLSKIDMI